MKEWAEYITKHLASFVEILAAAVIAIALVHFLVRYITSFVRPRSEQLNIEQQNKDIRIQFGSYLTVSLELLLAADILATAIAPTWDDIGKLAAIAALRTALNFFLERELGTTHKDKELQIKEK
jgi:uncharacterized membrane protein